MNDKVFHLYKFDLVLHLVYRHHSIRKTKPNATAENNVYGRFPCLNISLRTSRDIGERQSVISKLMRINVYLFRSAHEIPMLLAAGQKPLSCTMRFGIHASLGLSKS